MIKRLVCNLSWNRILNAISPNEHFYYIVNNFFKPDKINPIKFENNMKFIQYQYVPQPYFLSPSIFYFQDALSRPFFYADWFIAAYPDVAKWAYENAYLLDNTYPFKELIKFEQEPTYSYNLLRLIIDYYKRNINRRLECRF